MKPSEGADLIFVTITIVVCLLFILYVLGFGHKHDGDV